MGDVLMAREHYMSDAKSFLFIKGDSRPEFPFDCLSLYMKGLTIDEIASKLKSNRNCVSSGMRVGMMRTIFWRDLDGTQEG
jgi:hypothetical protein